MTTTRTHKPRGPGRIIEDDKLEILPPKRGLAVDCRRLLPPVAFGTAAGFIASLRTQLGHRAPRVTALPDGLTQLSARMGDWVPVTPWGTQALSLLTQDNVGDPAAMTQLLGRAPTHHSQLLAQGVR